MKRMVPLILVLLLMIDSSGDGCLGKDEFNPPAVEICKREVKV